jgi:hypothetical protein
MKRKSAFVRSLLEGVILKHEARRWQNVSTSGERK